MAPRASLVASVSLATFLLATLAATQFRSQPAPPASNTYAREAALRSSVNDLQAQQQRLSARVQALQANVHRLEDQTAQRSGAAQQAKTVLDQERMQVGLVALHGPGIMVSLQDGADPNDPNDRSLGWIVHYQDLQDLVNLLWAQGAEAIAVNGQRVTPTTSFFYAGVNILVNNASRLSGPYQVTALGDPPALEAGLNDPSQLAELKSRNRVYGLNLSWRRSVRVSIPAYGATFLLKYAQPVS
jgi:uncharacterized protein YlxW (UPF0749 family)